MIPRAKISVLLDAACVLTCTLLSALPPLQALSGAGSNGPVGEVVRIDAFFACDADDPDVTALPNGGFAVVWTAGGREIALRSYRSDLQPTGPGQLVNEDPSALDVAIGDVAVAAAIDGTVAVAWTDGEPSLRARLFDSAGAPLTGVLSLADGGPDPEVDLVALPDGSFVAVWQRDLLGGAAANTVTAIEALRFDRMGEELGRFEAVRIPDFSSNGFERALQPSVAVLGDDRLVISWNHRLFGFPFPFSDVVHAVFTLNGEPVGGEAPQRVEGSVPAVAARSGGYLQLWRFNGSIQARGFDEEGRALGPEATLRPMAEVVVSAPALTFSSGLGHAVWEERPDAIPPTAPPPPGKIRLRRLGRDGRPFGPAETLDFGLGSVGSDGAPGIAGLADGGVVVVGRHALAVGPADPVPCDAEFGILAKIVSNDELVLAGRFAVAVEWEDSRSGTHGTGHRGPQTTDTGSFWFFEPDNLELIVKVVDGRAVNGHFWVFYGALTDVGYRITVTDRVTAEQKIYENPQGRIASSGDVQAFDVPNSVPDSAPDSAPASGLDGAFFSSSWIAASTDSAAGPCTDPELPVVPRPGLCLNGRRFEVEVEWRDPRSGTMGAGRPIPVNDVTGGFWFFQPDNVELVVKVLDGRAVNGRFWVLYGSLTDVEFTLRVRHPETGDEVIFENPPFHFGSGADTTSLAPPDGV